jgi:hypothetical protein
MKNKFSLEIKSPCQENFSKMTANENGSFCNSCAKNVIDLSRKTNAEVATFIAKNKDATICARLKTSQLEEEFEINETSRINNFKYAVAVAATVLLTSNVVGQEKTPVKTEINCPKPNPEIMGKIAYVKTESKTISFVLKGKLLNQITKKPLSEKEFPNCRITINEAVSIVKLNPKTGDYSVSVTIDKSVKQISMSIETDDLHLFKTIVINSNSIKNEELYQNIFVNPKEFRNSHILGGLGINYIDTKKSNPYI